MYIENKFLMSLQYISPKNHSFGYSKSFMDIGIHKSNMSISDILRLMKKNFVYLFGLLLLAYTKITIVFAGIPIRNKRLYITQNSLDEKSQTVFLYLFKINSISFVLFTLKLSSKYSNILNEFQINKNQVLFIHSFSLKLSPI